MLGGARNSTDGGANWTNSATKNLIFSVNGDVGAASETPEPSTFALTLGAAALLYVKRRR